MWLTSFGICNCDSLKNNLLMFAAVSRPNHQDQGLKNYLGQDLNIITDTEARCLAKGRPCLLGSKVLWLSQFPLPPSFASLPTVQDWTRNLITNSQVFVWGLEIFRKKFNVKLQLTTLYCAKEAGQWLGNAMVV